MGLPPSRASQAGQFEAWLRTAAGRLHPAAGPPPQAPHARRGCRCATWPPAPPEGGGYGRPSRPISRRATPAQTRRSVAFSNGAASRPVTLGGGQLPGLMTTAQILAASTSGTAHRLLEASGARALAAPEHAANRVDDDATAAAKITRRALVMPTPGSRAGAIPRTSPCILRDQPPDGPARHSSGRWPATMWPTAGPAVLRTAPKRASARQAHRADLQFRGGSWIRTRVDIHRRFTDISDTRPNLRLSSWPRNFSGYSPGQRFFLESDR